MFTPKGIIFLTLVFTSLSLSCSGPDSDQPLLTAEMPLHLEEHIDDARIEGSEIPKDIPSPVEWDFSEPQQDWRPAKPIAAQYEAVKPVRVDDAVRLPLTEANRSPHGPFIGGAIYVKLPDLNLEDWAYVEISARTRDPIAGVGMAFNYTEEDLPPGISIPFYIIGARTPLITDGTVQRYRLPLNQGNRKWEGPWTHLGIWFTSQPNEEAVTLDILSVKVVPKEHIYADAPAGVRVEKRKEAQKRTLYTHTPGRIEYRVRIPEAGRLDFGLGMLMEKVPITFRIVASQTREQEVTLFEETYADPSQWTQRSVDLSAMAGKTVQIALEADAERPGSVALWAAPTLTGKTALGHPEITSADLLRLQLPDVKIASVEYQDLSKRPGRSHIKVGGLIDGRIGFEVLLPDEWNGRFVMGGGGGFVDSIQNSALNSVNLGYATAGTDTGHQSSGPTGSWALNDIEAQVNYAYVGIHRTAEVSKAIIRTYYGMDAKFSYFKGCSTGGGQALIEAQRYPEDFDGIISAAPVINQIGLTAARLYNAQHFFPDPNRLDREVVSKELLDRLYAEVIRQCDEIDGVKDYIIDDPTACSFDLSKFNGISDQQRQALQALYDGPQNSRGSLFPGMPLGSENQWYFWKSGSFSDLLKNQGAPNPGILLGLGFCKYFLFNDPNWDYSTYDLENWESDTALAEIRFRGDNLDLSGFKAAGGKLILWHGWSDGPLTPYGSSNYFKEVEKRDPDLRKYFRLFLLPGVQHCIGGVGPDRVDWLALLADWVERGKAPYRVIATKADNDGNTFMTRPVYPYPLKAKYKGQGSTDNEADFILP